MASHSAVPHWYDVANVSDVASPALLVYAERARENIRRMIAIAGGPDRLRPHMKTHKMAELIQMQLASGIQKFKCATIAECEMVAMCGAPDVLLAYQPVGPNIRRLLELIRKFPDTKFSTIVDSSKVAGELSSAATAATVTLGVLVDIDCGMHRSGIPGDSNAIELYKTISRSPGLETAGLHVYDGHLHQSDPAERTIAADAVFATADGLRQKLIRNGMAVPKMVLGGTPTFPIHARRPDVELSPGTCVLWDSGYANKLPDLDFAIAASLLTRVVSKPGPHRLCLDLGHKAVASENPHPRVEFLNLPDATAVIHSEEHLVVETPVAEQFELGDCVYAVPRHICPTVALHAQVTVVEGGRATGQWPVAARNRVLSM